MQSPTADPNRSIFAGKNPEFPGKRRTNALNVDIKATTDLMQGRSNVRKVLRALRSPGVQALVVFRFGQWLDSAAWPVRMVLEPLHTVLHLYIGICWGIDIERKASIGPGLYIGHYGGINISGAATLGKNCHISQMVTIGVAGRGADRGAPNIGDRVYIAPGAKLFGAIRIGDDSKIGANAVVHRSIPDGTTVVVQSGCHVLQRH